MVNSYMVGHPSNHYTLPEYVPSEPAESSEPREPSEPAEGTGYTPPAAPADDFGANLSPDALMAYCQSRLDSIDSQVKTSFDSQQRNASSIKQIDDAITTLRDFGGSDKPDPVACKQLETQLQGLIGSLKKSDPGCSALPDIETVYNSLVYSGDGGAAHTGSTNLADPDFIDKGLYPPVEGTTQGDNIVGAPEITGYVQTLTDAASSLSSDSELQMVHLQSLMSQRQTAISLTTNLVQSLGDQENKIADNIGH